jgi:potato proteinase inhibitor type I family protein
MPLTWTSPSGAGSLAPVRSQEEFKARLAKGRAFAPSLVGLEGDAPVQQVAKQGYQAQVIPATTEAVTLDLDSRRIRLFLDEHNIVVRATAG